MAEGGSHRPVEMTWVPALFTAYREIVDNALDEMVTHGNGDRLDITYNPKTMVFKVSDNGRGIPISIHPEKKIAQATLALSRAILGPQLQRRDARCDTWHNGVGAAIVNFCSEWFKIDINRDKKAFHQTFSEGEKALKIEEPLILPAPPKATTGTTIHSSCRRRSSSTSRCPRSSSATACSRSRSPIRAQSDLQRQAGEDSGPEKTLFAGKKPIVFEIKDKGFNSRFWLLPEFLEGEGEHSHGMVNAIPVFNGGSHIDTFKRLFYSGMTKRWSARRSRRS
jgi:DNA gyrase/topoisomerase IV subunit B